MSTHLGKISFLDLPDVNGQGIVIIGTGTSNQISTSQSAGTLTIGLSPNPIIPGTGALRLPVGTTAQRPGVPSAGDSRFNTTLGVAEVYSGTQWFPAVGKVLQVVVGTIAASSANNNQVPHDNTVPLITEGTQIWSQSFTPSSATSIIVITFTCTMSHPTVGRVITTSVFAGSTNIGAIVTSIGSASALNTAQAAVAVPLTITYAPGSTAAITFSARTGANGNGILYVNQTSAQTLGGAPVTDYIITEIEQ